MGSSIQKQTTNDIGIVDFLRNRVLSVSYKQINYLLDRYDMFYVISLFSNIDLIV